MNREIRTALERIVDGNDLSAEEMQAAMAVIMDGRSSEPVDGARGGQSILAKNFWCGYCQDVGGLRFTGRLAKSSSTSGLFGERIHAEWLGC